MPSAHSLPAAKNLQCATMISRTRRIRLACPRVQLKRFSKQSRAEGKALRARSCRQSRSRVDGAPTGRLPPRLGFVQDATGVRDATLKTDVPADSMPAGRALPRRPLARLRRSQDGQAMALTAPANAAAAAAPPPVAVLPADSAAADSYRRRQRAVRRAPVPAPEAWRSVLGARAVS